MSVGGEFGRRVSDDELCAVVRQAVEGGDEDTLRRLGFGGFAEYAQRLSEIMSDSVREGHDPKAEDFAAIMEEVARPVHYAHHLVNEAGTAVQLVKDEPLGIHMKPIETNFDDEAFRSTVGNAASKDDPTETVGALADGLGYFVKKTGNDFIKANAEAHSRAGFEVKVKRSGSTKCCPWCAARIGSWAIANAPDGVFGCHANCSCTVEYTSSTGAKTSARGANLHSYGAGAFVEAEYQPPHVLSREEAREKGGFDKPKKIYHIMSSSEIAFTKVDGAKGVDKKLLAQYRIEYDKFTDIFGALPILAGFNVAPYRGGHDYGGYNPYSREITLIGVGGKEGLAFITKVAQAEKKSGQWSTSSPYHTLRHELAHALYAQLQSSDPNWDKKIEAIKKLYDESKNQLTDLSENDIISLKSKLLSRYGFYNEKEFISESVAEYINSPKKARKVARTVAEILIRQEWEE